MTFLKLVDHLRVTAQGSTTDDLLQLQTYGGTTVFNVTSAGGAYAAGNVGIGATPSGAMTTIANNTAGNIGLVVKGAASQTADLARFQDSAATVVARVTLAGGITSAGATAGIGYESGAGGTVTQATSKATGVTLSKVTGQITMNAAALAAGTIVSFVLTNTAIAATDVVYVQHISGGTLGAYTCTATPAAGSATIYVRNNSAASLSEAIVLQYALIKAVTA